MCCSLTLQLEISCNWRKLNNSERLTDLLLSCSICCVDPERGMPWLHLPLWLGRCQVVVRLTWST